MTESVALYLQVSGKVTNCPRWLLTVIKDTFVALEDFTTVTVVKSLLEPYQVTGGQWVTTNTTPELDGHHLVTTKSEVCTYAVDGDRGGANMKNGYML